MAPENMSQKIRILAREDDIQAVCGRYKNWEDLDVAWKELAQDLYLLTPARLALTFQYDESRNELITKGVPRLCSDFRRP